MPPKAVTRLPAAEIQAMKAKKQAEKAAQAEKDAATKKRAAEKAARDKKVSDKRREMELAKAARLAAGGKPPAGPSKARERETQLMKLIKEAERHESGEEPDYELALGLYRDAMAGFTEMKVKRPKLAEKIGAIQDLIDAEATC
jgi:hypothetical protein